MTQIFNNLFIDNKRLRCKFILQLRKEFAKIDVDTLKKSLKILNEKSRSGLYKKEAAKRLRQNLNNDGKCIIAKPLGELFLKPLRGFSLMIFRTLTQFL